MKTTYHLIRDSEAGGAAYESPWGVVFTLFWSQVAIAALLAWGTRQLRGPSINVDGTWFTWMVWFEQEWVR